MIDRRDADLPAHMDEIVRAFGAALRQAREEEIERVRFCVGVLERLCDELVRFNAGLRDLRAAFAEPWVSRSVKLRERPEDREDAPQRS